MSVRITTVAKQLPPYSRETKEVIPFVETWLDGQEERFKRKVIKIFEGAAVDKRYSIMDPSEVFTATSFEEKNKIYSREVKKLGSRVLEKGFEKGRLEGRFYRLYHYCKLYRNHDPFPGCIFNQ